MNLHRCVCDDWIALITEGALAGKFTLHIDDETNANCRGSFTLPDGPARAQSEIYT